jgi:hypothetical protein
MPMDRSNHYEAAFEAYLQELGLCYVAVDETRRSLLGATPLKSLDFILYGPDGARLVVDVKGRRFPGGRREHPRRVWECWSTRADVDGLQRWAQLSGPDYRGLLVFSYHLQAGVELPADTEGLWSWRGRRYLLRGVASADYQRCMRVRSPRWDTVDLPRADFRRLVKPLSYFTHPSLVISHQSSEIESSTNVFANDQ